MRSYLEFKYSKTLVSGLFVSALLFPSLLSTDVSARSAALEKVIAGAKKEGAMKVLWTEGHFGGDVGLRDMVDAMNKRYGTNVKLQFTQGRSFPANLGRLTQEYKAKQKSSTDIFLGSGSHMVSGGKTGLLQKVDWNALIERPAPKKASFERVNPDGVGVAVASRVVGIVYNKNLVKGDDIPTSIEDVLKPKWKGLVATTPYVTGFYQFAAPDVFGEKFMLDYSRRLKPQIGGFFSCNSLDKLASGEFAMLIFDCGKDATIRYQRRGAPLEHAVPKEIVRNNIINLGVTSNADHPNVGKLFIAFTQTKEGQELLWKHGAYDLEVYPGSRSGNLVAEMRAKYPNAKFLFSTVQRTAQQAKDGIKLRSYQKKIKKILRGRKKK
ncbi:MAG: ABC transporter substrate-binding protein [Alphaproteobacteria bacterium]